MALVHLDGFDHYNIASTGVANAIFTLYPNVWSWTGTPGESEYDGDFGCINTMPELGGLGYVGPYEMNGSSGLSFDHEKGYSGPRTLSPVNVTTGNTFGLGFHYHIDDIGLSHTGIFGFGGTSGYANWSIFIEGGDGRLVFVRGAPGESAGTFLTSDPISTGTLYHLEFKVVCHATTGSIEVRIDGTTAGTLTGIDTTPDGSSSFFVLTPLLYDPSSFHQNSGSGTVGYDNLFFWDDSGSINNDFLGERNIYTLFPDGDTATEEWTLSGGTDSFALVDDVPADPLTNFLEAETDLDETIMTVEALPSSDIAVTGVQITSLAYKTGTTGTQLDAGLIVNSVEDVGTHALSQDSPQYKNHIVELSPDTSLAFTPAEINGMEVIIRRNDL